MPTKNEFDASSASVRRYNDKNTVVITGRDEYGNEQVLRIPTGEFGAAFGRFVQESMADVGNTLAPTLAEFDAHMSSTLDDMHQGVAALLRNLKDTFSVTDKAMRALSEASEATPVPEATEQPEAREGPPAAFDEAMAHLG